MKYMGSKNRIAKDIVPIIQHYIDESGFDTYLEPFVGGANVIDKINAKSKVGTDLNQYLIGLLKRVQEGKELLPEVSHALYSEVRSNYKSGVYEDWYVGNVGFLASYNGRFFDGGYAPNGYVKTKNGLKLRDYYQECKNNILSQAPNLKDILFYNCDYRTHDIKNAVIYCDPPYNGKTTYTNSRNFNHNEFWETMRFWSQHNIVLISEISAPADFKCIWEKQITRIIKAKDKTIQANEKLFIKG